jgi:hypothetical protein
LSGIRCPRQRGPLSSDEESDTNEDGEVKRRVQTLSLLLLMAGAAVCVAGNTIIWKPLGQAILMLDGKPPKTWNAYGAAKHDHWILVLLWQRYLLLDLREQAVYDLDPQKLKPKGETLEWSETDKPAEPIAITDWETRDVGPTRRIRFKFGKSGNLFEIQVPLRPDLLPLQRTPARRARGG